MFFFFNFFFVRFLFLRKFIFAKRHILQKQKPPKLANTKCEYDHGGHVRVQQDDDEHTVGAGYPNTDVLGDPADVGADAGVHVGRRSRQGSGVVRVRAQGTEQLWKKYRRSKRYRRKSGRGSALRMEDRRTTTRATRVARTRAVRAVRSRAAT